MKTYKEIGINFIKPQNKEGNDTIKDVLWDANAIIYKIANRPISPCNCHRYYNQFLQLARKLAEDVPTERESAKWKEVGQALKQYLNILKQYANYQFKEEESGDVQRLLNYQVHSYLEEKNKLTPELAVRILNDWKEIKEDYVDCFPFSTKTNQFILIKKELLEWLEKYYN